MRIPAVTEAYNAELRKLDGQRRSDKVSPKTKPPSADSSEFSSDAKRLSDTKSQVDAVATKLTNSPDVRYDKVAEAKQKIQDGFYDSEEVVDKLADKLLEQFGFRKSPL